MPGRTKFLKSFYSTVHAFPLKEKNAEWWPIKAGRSAIAGKPAKAWIPSTGRTSTTPGTSAKVRGLNVAEKQQ